MGLALDPGRVVVWYVPLSRPAEPDESFTPPVDELALLDPHERSRLERLVFPRDQRAFLRSHVALRRVLGSCLGLSPQQLQFEITPRGRPRLRGMSWPSFSLSQTRQLAAIAVSSGPVGVDVETPASGVSLALGAHVLSAGEKQDLQRLPAAEQTQRFLAYWTLKEAYLKALGLGLTDRLHDISFELDGGPRLVAAYEHDRERWSFYRLSPPGAHLGGLAVASSTVSGIDERVLEDWSRA